jgi:hypothetical protein
MTRFPCPFYRSKPPHYFDIQRSMFSFPSLCVLRASMVNALEHLSDFAHTFG